MVYNVAKNVQETDLRNYITGKGINIKDCSLLTKSNEARMLSYKITVCPTDVERVTKDESFWPYGVGVRFFKHFNRNQNNRNNRIPHVDSGSMANDGNGGTSPWLRTLNQF